MFKNLINMIKYTFTAVSPSRRLTPSSGRQISLNPISSVLFLFDLLDEGFIGGSVTIETRGGDSQRFTKIRRNGG